VSYPGTVESANFRGAHTACQMKAKDPFCVKRADAMPKPTAKPHTGQRTGPRVDRATAANQKLPAGKRTTLTIWTIGHSTHSLDEFVAMLKVHVIAQLVDVRTIPKSRRVPQFNAESLAAALPKLDIEYVHLKVLGGLRHAKKDSVNTGWRNASFRGYADYMGTDEFRQGIECLVKLARTKRTVIMCTEAVPWRCHRSLIGDALLVRGVHVEDIMSATSHREHELTPFAKVHGLEITYPGNGNQELFPK
jgi:hypothetical protein